LVFSLEVAILTYLHEDCAVDEITNIERQEKATTKLKNLKLKGFDDAIKE
jgi:hypothetical protein